MAINKILKKISKGWIVMMLVMNMAPLAHAQLSCEELNDPEKTKDYIISIIEEQFGEETNPDSENSTQVLRCVRKTVCEVKEKPKPGGEADEKISENECTSSYVGSGCTPSAGKEVCQTVDVFIAQSGIDLLFVYLAAIYRWSAGVIGIVSVFYLVYGGIKISTAGDNTAAIDEAKTKIGQSIGGLVLLFLSAVILYTINPNFFTF